MSKRKFRVPLPRHINGKSPEINAKSQASKLDLWGEHVEPGKYFGRLTSDGYHYHLYGSWYGDSVAVHRDESRDADPIARVYLTPRGGWWIKWLIFGPRAYGLSNFHADFVEFAESHPDLSR